VGFRKERGFRSEKTLVEQSTGQSETRWRALASVFKDLDLHVQHVVHGRLLFRCHGRKVGVRTLGKLPKATNPLAFCEVFCLP